MSIEIPLTKGYFALIDEADAGLFFHAQTGKWCAQICLGGRKRHLGLFSDELGAAIAYNAAAIQSFGEFSRGNTP